MHISDDISIVQLEGIISVYKLDEKRLYSNNQDDFDIQYFLRVIYTDINSTLIPYKENILERDTMFNRLKGILVREED